MIKTSLLRGMLAVPVTTLLFAQSLPRIPQAPRPTPSRVGFIIEGSVLSQQGNPIANAVVVVSGSNVQMTSRAQALTTAAGKYLLSGTAEVGTLTLCAQPNDSDYISNCAWSPTNVPLSKATATAYARHNLELKVAAPITLTVSDDKKLLAADSALSVLVVTSTNLMYPLRRNSPTPGVHTFSGSVPRGERLRLVHSARQLALQDDSSPAQPLWVPGKGIGIDSVPAAGPVQRRYRIVSTR